MTNEFIHWLSWPLFKKKAQSPNLRGVICTSEIVTTDIYTISDVSNADKYVTSETTTDIYRKSKVILDVL